MDNCQIRCYLTAGRVYVVGMTNRSLSYTEISTAYTCPAQWDMAYGGRLAGSTLRPKHILPILSEGRAWGAAVAAWHQGAGTLMATFDAVDAIHASLNDDFAQMAAAGAVMEGVLEQRIDMAERLEQLLNHYAATTEPLLNLAQLEETLDVPLVARSGGKSSSRYRFGAKIDGSTLDASGHEWIVEFKLRGQLHTRQMIELMRQYRWYAWARYRATGIPVVGVIVDERLNDLPKPAKVVQATKKADRLHQRDDGKWYTVSHDKGQLTTADSYVEVCKDYGVEPHQDVVDALKARRWQQRTYVAFRPSELEEAGYELTSAGKLIGQLDRGELFPVRNASPGICNRCKFKAICANPLDHLFVDQLFSRTEPKRLRGARQEEPTPVAEPALAF